MTTTMCSDIIHRLRGFIDDQDGVSAVEFAMLLPLMITLYLGSVEVTQAVSADRKMTLVASTVGDLVGQYQCVADSDLTAVWNAAKAVVYPFDSTVMKVTVSSVKIDANLKATVDWSKAFQGSTQRSGDVSAQIPTALKTANSSVIWAEAYYTYKPTIGKIIAPSGISLSEIIFLRPRLSESNGVPKC
jgi:Flp pilus assembly protein TadG